MKGFKYLFIILFILLPLISSQPCFAQATDKQVTDKINDQLKTAAEGKEGTGGAYTPADKSTLSQIAGIAVNAFLSFLGIIFIVLILYGGFTYMNARGEEDRVEKALGTIRRAVIGLIIVVGSYAIWLFIFRALLEE